MSSKRYYLIKTCLNIGFTSCRFFLKSQFLNCFDPIASRCMFLYVQATYNSCVDFFIFVNRKFLFMENSNKKKYFSKKLRSSGYISVYNKKAFDCLSIESRNFQKKKFKITNVLFIVVILCVTDSFRKNILFSHITHTLKPKKYTIEK